ncbi:MAG: metallophosphoesterase [Anaerolineae bacterium]
MTSPAPAPPPPKKPNPKVLENRWLHAAMVLFESFHRRPAWLTAAALVMVCGVMFAGWRWAAPPLAPAATAVFAAAVLLDALLLWLLPRRGISFGPLASQLLVMLLPRLAVAGLGAAVAARQPPAGLAGMAVLQLLGSAAYGWGMAVEPHRLSLTRLAVVTPRLPPGAPPIRLLHLSDLHLERLTRRETRLLKLVRAANADLIVITGDYLNLSYNKDPQAIAQVRQLLGRLRAPHGVYATLGSPPVDVPDVARRHFAGSHIQLLSNATVTLNLGAGRRLTLLGIDCTHDVRYDSYIFSRLNERRNGSAPAVLLYHSPELMPLVQRHGVDLYLCGHTHGGQVRLPGYGALITSAATGRRYQMGRYDENDTTLYVSRGIGLEGLSAPRLRLFCPPEITLVTLTGSA